MASAALQLAAFVGMLSIAGVILYFPLRHEAVLPAGWTKIRTGLILITSGLAMGSLKFIAESEWELPYDLLRYLGMYLCGVCLTGYGVRKAIAARADTLSSPEPGETDDELTKFSQQLLQLHENSVALSVPGTVQEVVRTILSKANEVTSAYLTGVMLLDPRSDRVDASYYSGPGAAAFEKLAAALDVNLKSLELVPERMEFLRRVGRERRINTGIEPGDFFRFFAGKSPLPGLADDFPARRAALIPLGVDGNADAMMFHLFPENPPDEAVLDLFGHQCSLAMRNAKVFEEMQQSTIALEVQRRKAEHANRSKTEFLANMSHELRTPLNAIIGFSEVLRTDIGEMPPEMAQQFIDNINTSGRHLLELVNDLLDLSRLEIGRLKLERSHFKLPDELAQAVRIVDPMAREKNIKVVTEFKEPVESIFADPQKLRQIIINLLSNAVKFSRADAPINLIVRKDKSSVQFCVEDFGMGIKSQDIERLFRPFEQLAQNPYAKKYRGVGLGLALTRRLVELHGGRVWAESEIGRGSKFFFTVPQ